MPANDNRDPEHEKIAISLEEQQEEFESAWLHGEFLLDEIKNGSRTLSEWQEDTEYAIREYGNTVQSLSLMVLLPAAEAFCKTSEGLLLQRRSRTYEEQEGLPEEVKIIAEDAAFQNAMGLITGYKREISDQAYTVAAQWLNKFLSGNGHEVAHVLGALTKDRSHSR